MTGGWWCVLLGGSESEHGTNHTAHVGRFGRPAFGPDAKARTAGEERKEQGRRQQEEAPLGHGLFGGGRGLACVCFWGVGWDG